MANRSWSDLSTRAKAAVVLGAALQAALTTLALRDLQSRPKALVRGSKWLWRVVALIQPVGPIAYLAIGRRQP